MSGVYSVVFNAVSVSLTQDLFQIVASSTKPAVILGYDLSQITDHGDTAEEILTVAVKSGQTTTGSGGGTPTPVPTDSTATAAGFVALTNNTTKASAGTIVTHHVTAWNTRMPLQVLFTQEQQLVMVASRRATIEITAPAGARSCNGTLWVQEIG